MLSFYLATEDLTGGVVKIKLLSSDMIPGFCFFFLFLSRKGFNILKNKTRVNYSLCYQFFLYITHEYQKAVHNLLI